MANETEIEGEIQAQSTDRGRQYDPELLSIGRIMRMLEELDAPARSRVMAYLSHRYYGVPSIGASP